MKKTLAMMIVALMSVATFAENRVPSLEKNLITPPETAAVEVWNVVAGNLMMGAENGWEDMTAYVPSMYVCFDGDDVYIQGVALFMPEGWIKGTKNGTTVTFASGQYVGTDQYGDEYINGQDVNAQSASDPAIDVVFHYDAEAGTLSLDEQVLILESQNPNSIATTYAYWEGLVLAKPAPVPDAATLPEGAEVKPWTVTGCPVQLAYDEQTGQSTPKFGETEQFNVNVAIVGSDFYIQGLNYFSQDTWIKGELADGKVTFATGQNYGIYTYTPEDGEPVDYQTFFLGFGTEGVGNVVFTYDDATQTLDNTDASWIVTSMSPTNLNYYIDIYLVANIKPAADDTAISVTGQFDNATIGQFDNCYDLSGRKMAYRQIGKSANGRMKKGIYIHNGRKVVVK